MSRRMFMPGKFTVGVDPKKIPRLDERDAEGVTQSEFAMIAKVEQNITSKSIAKSPPMP
jgi:hypothetical protein